MRFWLKMTMLLAPAAVAWASPAACVAGNYASYEASSGCTVGDETFSNFSSLSVSATLGLNLTDTEIIVTPMVSGNVDELLFTYTGLPTGGGSGDPSSTQLGVNTNQNLTYDFSYIITPNPNPVVSFQMKSDIGNTGSGSVSAVKNTTLTGTTSSADDGGTPHTLPSLVSGAVISVSATSAFTVQDTISLQGQTGSAQQQDYTNLFAEGAVSTTPEPSTTLLIGSGLLCFGLVRKHRSSRG